MHWVFYKLSSLTIFQSLLLLCNFENVYYNACDTHLLDMKLSFCNLEVTSCLTLFVIVSIYQTKVAGLNCYDIACSVAFCYKG